MINYLVTKIQLQAIANKLREKTGTVGVIRFVDEFISEIEKLTDTRDANAVSGDILDGKTAYVNKQKVTGNIPSKSAETFNTSSSDRTIDSGKYLSGAQTIKGVTTENISAENIKKGVVVKVGDANNSGRLKNITGSFTGDADAVASDILSGKTAYVNGEKITGNIASKSAETFNTSGSDRTIASGKYLSGTQTIKGVTTENISAGNIKKGVVVKVGDANSAGRIKNITGTYITPSNYAQTQMNVVGDSFQLSNHIATLSLRSVDSIYAGAVLYGVDPYDMILYKKDGSGPASQYGSFSHFALKKINSMSIDSSGRIYMSVDIVNIASSVGTFENVGFPMRIYLGV